MRYLTIVLCVIAGLLAACGDSGAKTEAGPPKEKVGLLVTGSTADGGWNQLAADSLKKLETTEGIETAVLQNVSKDKAADAIREFDSKGYALVIAHGYEYLDVVKELTDPAKGSGLKVKIAVSGGDVESPGFECLFYDLSQASYQLGVVAGKVSKTGKLGFVAGAPLPTVTSMLRGFEAGAKSVNPKVTVAAQYTGWDDPSKAKKQVEAFIADGVDVVMQNVDAASSGVFEVVKEYNSKPHDGAVKTVYTFGANSDQNDNKVCGEYTLASAVIRMEMAFGKVVNQIKRDSFKGGLVKEDVGNGVGVAILNPKLVGKLIDADTQKLVEEAGKKLAAGEIKIPVQ